jgi:hypothetical protein
MQCTPNQALGRGGNEPILNRLGCKMKIDGLEMQIKSKNTGM